MKIKMTLENQDDIPKFRSVEMYEVFMCAAYETAQLIKSLSLLKEDYENDRNAEASEFFDGQCHSLAGLLAILKSNASSFNEQLVGEFGSIEAARKYRDNCKLIPVD